MESLYFWSMVAISVQTIFSVTFSWLILDCKLPPYHDEYYEVTLLKLLYLYDPAACGKRHFYNMTLMMNGSEGRQSLTLLLWPTNNAVSAAFRLKMQIWLGLHILWFLLGLLNMNQTARTISFHARMLPFTLVGMSLLVLDLVYTGTFVKDALQTGTEVKIVDFINGDSRDVNRLPRDRPETIHMKESASDVPMDDTSWIGLLLAFGSCRCIVLWFINFWIVKDNYFEGLASHRRLLSYKTAKARHHSKHYA